MELKSLRNFSFQLKAIAKERLLKKKLVLHLSK